MVELCIALLILGIIFLLLEMWLPGVEYFAIIGLISLAVSAVLAIMFVPLGWIIVVGQILIVAAFLHYMLRYMKKKQLQGKLILSDNDTAPKFTDLSNFMGKEGRAVTILRPSGDVDFGGISLEVSSDGPLIEQGTKVRVIKAEPNKLTVTAVDGN